MESPLTDISIANLHVRMLPEDRVDKRATSGFVFKNVQKLSLRQVEGEWDTENPEPKRDSVFVFRRIRGLQTTELKGRAARKGAPAIVEQDEKP